MFLPKLGVMHTFASLIFVGVVLPALLIGQPASGYPLGEGQSGKGGQSGQGGQHGQKDKEKHADKPVTQAYVIYHVLAEEAKEASIPKEIEQYKNSLNKASFKKFTLLKKETVSIAVGKKSTLTIPESLGDLELTNLEDKRLDIKVTTAKKEIVNFKSPLPVISFVDKAKTKEDKQYVLIIDKVKTEKEKEKEKPKPDKGKDAGGSHGSGK